MDLMHSEQGDGAVMWDETDPLHRWVSSNVAYAQEEMA